MTTFKESIKGKKVLVFGLGLQGGGLGDALWLHSCGATVRVTDQKPALELTSSLAKLPRGVELSLGGHSDQDIAWADLVLKNPGVPDDQPQILLAEKLRIPVQTSIALVVSEGRDKVIAVTGTRGKSTTTRLIFELLASLSHGKVELGGNIPETSGLKLLDKLGELKYLVLELSSFQLHSFHKLKLSPHLAVITNMYPDHLNRYSGMDTYFFDKSALTAYQSKSDLVLYHSENDYAKKLAQLSPGTLFPFSKEDVPAHWDIKIPGIHNRENIAAVVKLAEVMSIDLELVKRIIEDFHGLPFRQEVRRILRGVTYINDTTSTTPTSTIKAIETLTSPAVMIVGGADKKLPFEELVEKLASSLYIKKIILLGSDGIPDFTRALKASCPQKILSQVYSMKEAVALASETAENGWNVILSPGFFSFDLFKNEFDRGRQFNEEVAKLA